MRSAEKQYPAEILRGRMLPGEPPRLKTSDGRVFTLSGDTETIGVLKDPRVTQYDVEVVGQATGEQFRVNPIHTPALFAYKDSHRYQVTYWCPICSIRSYTPGKCWCCQEETNLDLIEPAPKR